MRARHDETGITHYSVVDVLRVAGYCGSKLQKKCDTTKRDYMVFDAPSIKWNQDKWTLYEHQDDMLMVPENYLRDYALHILKGKRKMVQRQAIMSALGLEPEVAKNMNICIEEEVLQRVRSALGWRMKREVVVKTDTGKVYRVDAVFPDQGLAVSIKEHDHKSYDEDVESVRRAFMNTQFGKFIEFDVHQPLPIDAFHISDLLMRQMVEYATTMAARAFAKFVLKKI